MLDAFFSGVADWAVRLMETLGAPGAGLAVALENLFPPLPSEAILPLAGFTASQGTLVLWHLVVWTTVGSVVGALALYGLGAWLGSARLRRLADRMPLLSADEVAAAEAWFQRHGEKSVLFGRLVPLVRSFVSIPAGVERMHLGRFLMLTTLGSGCWNTVLLTAGYLLGEQWHRVEAGVGYLHTAVVIGLVVLVVVWIARKLRRAAAGRREGTSTDAR
ncbi:DedA family protein [Isoptericola variabilis]|uniref:SNARE associated Golgi protein n=1 Tax=Isoptericola variabilis (strain 225) TaxID=743718 RepID=F6FX32_ISOV2|nr:DedA family protein [Isoptericola variabilis]AEG44632.1 SNARE associated Golgi protein [Isoptericola variabilis 225]TWH28320.1 membrane protein DedA with SNARE-associated domain [Isoptericola variabilis J7]